MTLGDSRGRVTLTGGCPLVRESLAREERRFYESGGDGDSRRAEGETSPCRARDRTRRN